jgi:hypothetical protein
MMLAQTFFALIQRGKVNAVERSQLIRLDNLIYFVNAHAVVPVLLAVAADVIFVLTRLFRTAVGTFDEAILALARRTQFRREFGVMLQEKKQRISFLKKNLINVSYFMLRRTFIK